MSSPADRDRKRRRCALALLLAGLLFGIYLLTFSGVPTTDDERMIIDTTESMAVHGNLQLNQTAYLRPIQTTDVEPAQPLLSVPLYWLAYHTPWVGNVHALYLFAPLVTALTAVVLFLYALDLGYRERTALAAALLYGLATIAWPYAKTYFREPLMTLSLFAAAFLLNRWRAAFRAGSGRHWLYLGVGVAATLIALLSKEVSLIALPVLALIAYPGSAVARQRRRQIVTILVVLAVVAVIFAAALVIFRTEFYALATRYAPLARLARIGEGLPAAAQGFAGYLLSPGRGIWWFSPVLLLALGAPAVLPRARWRESWLPLGFMLLFALAYAALRGPTWTGGTGWGARYLIPLVPFLMVAALPLIDRMLNSARWWPRLALGALALWGLVIQVVGAYTYLYSYYDYASQALNQPPWQGPFIWSFRWSQPVGSLLYLGQAQADIRWLLPSPDWLALAVIAAGAALAGGALVWLAQRERLPARAALVTALAVPLGAAALSVFVLWRAYADPRLEGGSEPLAQARAYLAEQAGPQDTILLSSPGYVAHFMNYYKGRTPWYSMPLSPGERYSPEQEPAVVSDRLEDLIARDSARTAQLFSQTGFFYNGNPIWLVADLGPALPWATRPVEWHLSQTNYQAGAVDFSHYVRVVKYLPFLAPSTSDRPAHRVDALLGDRLRLAGFDLVTNDGETAFETLTFGDMLGISLLWQAEAAPGVDYTVAVHVIGPEGVPVLQHDRAPVGGFAPTGAWQPGDLIRDNYGFTLPESLPPGRYEIWVLAYTWPSLERLPVTGPQGEDWGDHLVLAAFELR